MSLFQRLYDLLILHRPTTTEWPVVPSNVTIIPAPTGRFDDSRCVFDSASGDRSDVAAAPEPPQDSAPARPWWRPGTS